MIITPCCTLLDGHPEYLVIYVNEDKLDTVNGVDYDAIICDELADLEMIEKSRGITICSDEIIPICPTGHELKFDTLSVLDYTPVNTKHVKPFYHKGRW